MNFAEKIALITGGSSGIGLATAKQLARHGAHVWLIARNPARLETAIASLETARIAAGQRFGQISADVADAAQAAAAVERVTATIGLPDLLINAAGVIRPGYFQELDLSLFQWMMNINYFGTLHTIKAVVPGMLARGSGHIVNISSLAGIISIFGYTAYSASKFAVRGLSDALRSELRPRGIDVSIVFPPDTDTPQLADEKRYRPPETSEIAGSAKTLSADEVATAILGGIKRRQYLILPGLESKLLYWVANLAGPWQYPIMDWLVARARRNR